MNFDYLHLMRSPNYYVEYKELFEYILDEPNPCRSNGHIFHVLLIPIFSKK